MPSEFFMEALRGYKETFSNQRSILRRLVNELEIILNWRSKTRFKCEKTQDSYICELYPRMVLDWKNKRKITIQYSQKRAKRSFAPI